MSNAFWVILIAVIAVLNIRVIRRPLLSRHLLKWFRSVLPPISETESAAIDAGSVWWDSDLFAGSPDWRKLLDEPAATLTDEEQAFLDGPTETLCQMLDEWQIKHELNDLSPEAWQFMQDERFFGMLISKDYGGLGFSPLAQSEVFLKIATRSMPASMTVIVPNSLGPGELLLHYGTEEQKNHYLPRLAVGKEIPAFALTSPWAGSDAAAMVDEGVVEYGEYEGERVLGLRLNWEKRYITLGPVCTVLGLAFKVRDPDGLLSDNKNPGITCALVPASTPGVEIGARHEIGVAMQNGPNRGRDVFIPLDFVIGGPAEVGNGWRMLMDCLSVGRAVSLPAFGTAAGKVCARTTGAYARVRKQFGVPIGYFEGIEEPLARIAGITYRMDSARIVTAIALNQGEKPAIIGAILKYHNTEGMRQVVNDALDVHGGRGVCDGPANYLKSIYESVPVAITVEGANILTRSLIIFGQGAIRCHPYVLAELKAAADEDEAAGIAAFDRAFFAHVRLTTANAFRAFVFGATGGLFQRAPVEGKLGQYLNRLSRFSAAFSFVSDVAMLTLGGDLKRREKLSARLGDVLSHLYMASAVIKRFYDDGQPDEDFPLVEWNLEESLRIIETQLVDVLENARSRFIAGSVRFLIMPFGRRHRGPSDDLGQSVARLLLAPSATRDRLVSGSFVNHAANDPTGIVEQVFQDVFAAEAIEKKIYKASGKRINPANVDAVLASAETDGIITAVESRKLSRALKLTKAALAVDSFNKEGLVDESGVEVGAAG